MEPTRTITRRPLARWQPYIRRIWSYPTASLWKGGLIDVLDAARADGAAVISVGEFVDPIPFATGSPDPHVWLDPHRVADAARLIAVELATVSDDVDWIARAEAYADELLALDAEIDAMLSTIPADARQIVTNHDALGYFAARYDFEIVGVVVRGGSTVANPSSAELAELVAQISSNNIRAIFAETIEASALAEAVASEIGRPIQVVCLYTGSLGEPGSGRRHADRYVANQRPANRRGTVMRRRSMKGR